MKLIENSFEERLEEYSEVAHKRMLWDLIKYKVKYVTTRYCAQRKEAKQDKEKMLYNKLHVIEVELNFNEDLNLREEYSE